MRVTKCKNASVLFSFRRGQTRDNELGGGGKEGGTECLKLCQKSLTAE